MKIIGHILFIVTFYVCMNASGQNINYAEWLKHIDDSTKLSSLSIPGAHNAATGEGLRFSFGLGVTQKHTLSELWDSGVRAFDLRPAVNGAQLHIYHGPIKTNITFDEALNILCGKLKEHPCEFAIVLLREESDAENNRERKIWPSAIGKSIAGIGNTAAVFSPNMRVKDLRGKILFLSRNNYCGTDKGAIISGWSHSSTGAVGACITSCADKKKTPLQVQDFYITTNKERQEIKTRLIDKFIDIANDNILIINMLSAYSSTVLGCTPWATTSGYKKNAKRTHCLIIEKLKKRPSAMKKTLGIVFMDYAATDYANGSIWHWRRFKVDGEQLLKLIISNNF